MNVILVKIGTFLNHIPYTVIPIVGSLYNKNKKDIMMFDTFSVYDKKRFIYDKIFKMVAYAIENVSFYREFYKQRGFVLSQLNSFEDISKIPIVTKKELMSVPLKERTAKMFSGHLANTGGSTGMPLLFYKTWKHQIKEMAYYHQAWQSLGFKPSELRLQFVGQVLPEGLKYDLTRNRLIANIYMPFEKLINELTRITRHNHVAYLQGYPSVLYEFALFLEDNSLLYERSGLKGQIKGIFLNSEYPYPNYRNKIEHVFGVKTIASYGHTEGCALAFDSGNQSYQVVQSYGYAEAVELDNEWHIVSTSYDNFISPFIRYDTGDIVDNIGKDNGIMKSFSMTEGGREGQFVFDKDGRKISLTGLIFGRHHQLFNYCSQIQLSQEKPGSATVYYVANEEDLHGEKVMDLFDASEVEISFTFKRLDKPIRTNAGKVLLLVSGHNIENQ